MKNFFAALTTVVAVVTGPALAADMNVKPMPVKAPMMPAAYNWTGFYIGVNAGGAWANFDPTTSTVFSPTGYFALSSVPAIAAAGLQTSNPSGFTGGGQAGYNWQSGFVVFGVEADFEALHLSGTTTTGAVYPCCAPTAFSITSTTNTNWLFTARPRIGIANNNWLFYATGGLAVTDLHGTFTFADTFATAAESASISTTKAGWTVGGGVEAALWGNWILRGEYLYVNMGTETVTSTNLVAFTPRIAFPTNVFTHTMDLKASIARAGLSYKF
jgi:outer membrane immunogenic protein